MIFWSLLFNENTRFHPIRRRAPSGTAAPISPRRSRIAANATRRAISRLRSTIERFAGAVTAGWHAFNISSDKGSGVGAWSDDELSSYLSTGHASGRGTASGPMGEAVDQSFSAMAVTDIHALVTYLRSVPAIASSDLPATIAPPAPAAPKDGGVTSDVLGKRVFEQACASCHSWTGVSAITPYATISGTRAVNDSTATNVAQIVISGAVRQTPPGVVSMPAFGSTYSDTEIAAVANYVTGRLAVRKPRSPAGTWRSCGAKPAIDEAASIPGSRLRPRRKEVIDRAQAASAISYRSRSAKVGRSPPRRRRSRRVLSPG